MKHKVYEFCLFLKILYFVYKESYIQRLLIARVLQLYTSGKYRFY